MIKTSESHSYTWSVESDFLETAVFSAKSGNNVSNWSPRRRPTSRTLVAILQIQVRYSVNLSRCLLPQLQVLHLQWLMSGHSVSDLHSCVPVVLHFVPLRGVAAKSNHISVRMSIRKMLGAILHLS
jgi:hypothetical protein